MKIKILISCVFISNHFLNIAQAPETIWQLLQDGSIIRWALTFNDEFNENQLDTEKWETSYPWGRNYDPTTYMEYMTNGQNFEFLNGNLNLIAKNDGIWEKGVHYLPDNYIMQDGLPNLRWWPYTSGMIFSKRKFKYGLFEIKCTLPIGKGLWPAFWLYEGNPHEEFDIFEYKGESTNKFHIDVHCPTNCSQFGAWVTTTAGLNTQSNVFMGEWGPEFSFWYFNYSDFAIWLGEFNQPMNIIANHGISALPDNGDSPSFNGKPDISTPFPAYYNIDYIRVWNRLNCNSNILLTSYAQGVDDESVITGKNVSINNLILNNNQYLDIIATESISINSTSEINGNFETKIVDCPGPQKSSNSNSFDDLEFSNSVISISNDSTELLSKIKEISKTPYLYVKIYPNPTNNKIEFSFDGNLNLVPKIEIFELSGKLVKHYISDGEKKTIIDVSDLPKGKYIIRGSYGTNSIEENLIIQ